MKLKLLLPLTLFISAQCHGMNLVQKLTSMDSSVPKRCLMHDGFEVTTSEKVVLKVCECGCALGGCVAGACIGAKGCSGIPASCELVAGLGMWGTMAGYMMGKAGATTCIAFNRLCQKNKQD
jgi:hypothetical protein